MSLEVMQTLEGCGVKVVQSLTAVESNILDVLVGNQGKIVSKAEIEDTVYGGSDKIKPASNCVEVFVARLRKKLTDRKVVRTVRGKGYMVVLPEPVADAMPQAEAAVG
jgi:DNA-binding response OmpR family regulator